MTKCLIQIIFLYLISIPAAFSTGLHDAISEGDADKVKMLLELGADIESTDDGPDSPYKTFKTPLWRAVNEASAFSVLKKGNGKRLQNLMEIIQLLISSGAKIDKRNQGFGLERQDPALHRAVYGYNVTLAKLLLDSGASVNSKTADKGDYPIVSALDTTQFSFSMAMNAKYLAKSDEDKASLQIEMLLWPATRKKMVLLLIQYGANINVKDKSHGSNKTPLHNAVEFGIQDTVKVLVEYGAKTNIKDYDGHTPLYAAVNASEPDMKIIEILNNADQIRSEKLKKIKEVQILLQKLGYYSSSIDGIYGMNTAAAIREYQIDNVLDEDGDATDRLISHIKSNIK